MAQRLHVGKCINSVKMHTFFYANKESGCADEGFAVEILVPTALMSSKKQMAQTAEPEEPKPNIGWTQSDHSIW